MMTWPTKDPDEVLDYDVDWADTNHPRLESGETLVDSDFTVEEGDVTIESSEFAASGLAKVWLSGGTPDTACVILNRVTTSAGRTYDQSVKLRIRTR